MQFSEELKGVDRNTSDIPEWNSDTKQADVNDLWERFKSTFVTVADRHAPVIEKCVREMDNCVWISGEIKIFASVNTISKRRESPTAMKVGQTIDPLETM